MGEAVRPPPRPCAPPVRPARDAADGRLTAAFLLPGGSDDWAKGVAGMKYAFTIELRDTGRHGFVLPSNHILSSGKEVLAAVRTLAQEVALL